MTPYEFYEDVFPDRETKGVSDERYSNPIVTYTEYRENTKPLKKELTVFEDGTKSETYDLYTNNRIYGDKNKVRYYRNEIMFAGTDGRATLDKCINNEFALCSLCSYYGRNKRATNAYKLHGFCVDLDGVGEKQLMALWYYFTESEVMPMPTYLINSGHGLHVLYLFEEPIPLYPQIRAYLRQLYRGLEVALYTRESTKLKPENIQGHLNIYQSFRMVGSYNSKSKTKMKLRAFKIWKRVTLEYLNRFVDEEYKIPILNDVSEYGYMEDHKTLEQCKEFYPEWYQRRIVEGLPTKQWICNRKLYDWWIDKIQNEAGARLGNRYYCIGFMYAYAIKCNISKEEVRADAEMLLPLLQKYDTPENPFTLEDLKAAEDFYKPDSARISIKYIETKTNIQIKRRNKAPLAKTDAIKLASVHRDIKHPDKSWINRNGRPDASETVAEWRKAHPDGKKSQCIKDTGLAKATVYNWWDGSAKYKPAEKQKTVYAPNSIEQEMQEAGLTDEQIKRMIAHIQDYPHN